MKKVCFIGLIIFLTACGDRRSDKKLHEDLNTHVLEKVGNLVFQIDNETKRFGNLFSYNEASGQLCLYNNFNNSIYFYDVVTRDLKKKIKLEKAGPNGVPRVSGFFVQSEDSIFTFDEIKRELFIVNKKAEVIFKKKILEPDEPGFPAVPNFTYRQGKAYFSVLGYFNAKPELKTKSVFVYDINTGKKTFLVDTPEEYGGNWSDKIALRYGALIPSLNSFVSSWPMGTKMKVVSLASGKDRTFSYESNRIHKTKPFKGGDDTRRAQNYYVNTNSWHQNVFYDPFQKVLLRSVSVGKNIPKGESPATHHLSLNNDRVYVVTELFNENFEKIGEVPGTVFYNEIFSNENGIYMADYLSDEENEDIISFEHYRLKVRN